MRRNARFASRIDPDGISKVSQRSYRLDYKSPQDRARISCSVSVPFTTLARTQLHASAAYQTLWLQSGLQLPRGASSALCFAEIRSSPFKGCRAVLRRTYVDATPACRTTPAPPVTHAVSVIWRFGTKRADGPGAGEEEERFRCASPAAIHGSYGGVFLFFFLNKVIYQAFKSFR